MDDASTPNPVEQFRELGRVLEEIKRALDPQVLASAPATVAGRVPRADAHEWGTGLDFQIELRATGSAATLEGAPTEDPDLVPNRHRSFHLSRGRDSGSEHA